MAPNPRQSKPKQIENQPTTGAVQGIARLSLRPARAPAFAAGLGAAGLPCVALFLAFREVPLTPKQSFDAGLRGYPRERVMSGSGAPQSRSIP